MRWFAVLLILGSLVPSAWPQSATSSDQKQDAILAELRAIHRDLRANITGQLLIAELQLAHASVNKASDHRDAVRAQLNTIQQEAQFINVEIPRAQDSAEKATEPSLKAAMTGRLADLKRQLANNGTRQQDQAEQLREAENQLRTARTEMESLQSELDNLVKRLSPAN